MNNINIMFLKSSWRSLALAGQFFTASLFAQEKIDYPFTAQEPVTETYHGKSISDPFRWLEDDRSAKTTQWVKDQNLVTEKYLQNIPERILIKKRLTQLWNYSKQSAPFKKGQNYFSYKNDGLQNQSVLYIHKSPSDKGEVLLDPNRLSEDGTVSLSGVSISSNGKILAYGISKAGSDWVEIHFLNIETKKDLPDVLQWVKFSSMSWKGEGIYYSRYEQPDGSALTQKNQFHKLCYHKLGEKQERDKIVYEDKNNSDYNFSGQMTEDEKYLCLYTSKSTSGHMLHIKDLSVPASQFTVVSSTFEHENYIVDNVGDVFYMRTDNKAPNYRLISFKAGAPKENSWQTVIPESKHLLESVRICNHKFVVAYLENVSSRLYVYNLNGKKEQDIPLQGICRISSFHSSKKDTFASYSTVSFTSPEQTFKLDTKFWKSSPLFKPEIDFHSDTYVTKQVFFNSKDGTTIPMFITHRKDIVPNESTPCFVYGYGGFNISLSPEFRIDRAVFLEAGGIYCVPNLRGGGEYGEEWHSAGTKCKKQNVFDDFIAACDYLVAKKMTSYEKIAIHGRSNGGLLIGAVMTQRPDICKVAIPTVGVLDMLRFHLFTIGRAWTVDYGCSENAEEFECLIQYSPYHNLNRKKYPATLVLTGDHDDRVVPAHSFKFAAALQAYNMSSEPSLIRIDVNAGHGSGKPTAKQIEEFADMWAFVFFNLKVKYGS
jgi:prolyl oligopeptidase